MSCLFIVMKVKLSNPSNLFSMLSKSDLVALYLHSTGSFDSTVSVVVIGLSTIGDGNANELVILGAESSTLKSNDFEVIPYTLSLHFTKSLWIAWLFLFMPRDFIVCLVPVVTVNLSINSYSKLSSTSYLHSALLSVSIKTSKV